MDMISALRNVTLWGGVGMLLCAGPALAADADREVRNNVDQLVKTNACVGCNLKDADLNRLDLAGADLRDADLRGALLFLVDLSGSDLRGAKLSGAQFGGADLADADLRGADVQGAVFAGTYLVGAKLDDGAIADNSGSVADDSQQDTTEGADDGAGEREQTADAQSVLQPDQPEIASKAVDDGNTAELDKKEPEQGGSEPTSSQTGPDAGSSDAPVLKQAVPPSPVSIEKADDQAATGAPQGVEHMAVQEKDIEQTDLPPQEVTAPAVTVEGVEPVEQQGLEKTPEPAESPDNSPDGDSRADTVARLLDSGKCYGCNLAGADLSGKRLKDADLEQADFTGAKLDGTDFSGANLKKVSFRNAQLTNADFSDTDLYKADFTGADLTGAVFEDAQTDEATFIGTVGYRPVKSGPEVTP